MCESVCVCVCACMHMHVYSIISNSATSWTVAHRGPLSMGFSRQGYWRGLPFPPPMGSSQPGDWTCISWVSSIGRWILLHLGSHIYIYIHTHTHKHTHINTHILCMGPLSDTWFEMFSPTCVLFFSFSVLSFEARLHFN